MAVLDHWAVFVLGAVLGGLVEIAVMRAHHRLTGTHYLEHHFTFAKYLLFLLVPVVGLSLVTYRRPSLIAVFLIFSVLGPLLEWASGRFYHAVMGQRLWTYHRYAIGKYTSWLTIPMWGCAGVLFVLLASKLQ